jgi:solute carrier family 25 S-adenosylmethionine transporter 26
MSERESPFTLALIAGGCAGTAVDVALHPLDTLRTRIQSQEGFIASGGFRGVYRGILSAAMGSAPGAAVFFSTYETMKGVFKSLNGGKEEPLHHACASSCGEVGACAIRVPTAVVTQNMQVGNYNTLTEAVRGTIKNGGMMGFYRGYGTTVAREIPFAFIQFPIYEGFKSTWASWQGQETNAVQGAACGSIAGAIAGAVTTPLDVCKTRIMLEKPVEGQPKRYTGTYSTLSTIAKEEGTAALFKGIGPRVMWITIGGFIFFGAYEQATRSLFKTRMWDE